MEMADEKFGSSGAEDIKVHDVTHVLLFSALVTKDIFAFAQRDFV